MYEKRVRIIENDGETAHAFDLDQEKQQIQLKREKTQFTREQFLKEFPPEKSRYIQSEVPFVGIPIPAEAFGTKEFLEAQELATHEIEMPGEAGRVRIYPPKKV